MSQNERVVLSLHDEPFIIVLGFVPMTLAQEPVTPPQKPSEHRKLDNSKDNIKIDRWHRETSSILLLLLCCEPQIPIIPLTFTSDIRNQPLLNRHSKKNEGALALTSSSRSQKNAYHNPKNVHGYPRDDKRRLQLRAMAISFPGSSLRETSGEASVELII